jgi:hypothetical protein
MSEHTETTEQELFTISRTFDAPRSLVWQAWTDSEQLAQWWGPKGCKLRVDRLDFRPGGVFIYAMEFQPGQEMWADLFIVTSLLPKSSSSSTLSPTPMAALLARPSVLPGRLRSSTLSH